MDDRTMPSTFTDLIATRFLPRELGRSDNHIVDQLIAERAVGLSSHPLWPLMRPLLYRFLHYSEAVRMADRIAPLSGSGVLDFVSDLLSLDIQVAGAEHIPARGGFIMACSHPTGIADAVAAFDVLKTKRSDISIFANRDALRVSPRLGEVLIPVEWRAGEKSRAKSRATLEQTARAFAAERAVLLFPSGRIAYWNKDHVAERPWQTTLVSLARRYDVPIVPVSITSRNSWWFYFASQRSTELRDMTVFHELLNKKRKPFAINVGKPVTPEQLDGDASEVTQRLQDHTVIALRDDPGAEFRPA
ncbi:MAG: 1-acyl-sn-glycerol-3-phosphate acyltransferase [Rhizobiaceae bacterium]|nr:1-acyl-sn-glycerol-3-phosphate acyltransferase [Rhizobiaceae bacterium]